ncbi:hypothetical protein E6H26_06035 [Candidatus Bathyarchaeota archaeon]|nr:MAG: hypothetical protein E6H26_06035 [Candidatus Bathyarchaeota archaeon]
MLIYKVNYPQTPTLTTVLSNPYMPQGGTTNITGSLSYPSGLPVLTAVKPVVLQYATTSTGWTLIGNATITSSGSFAFPDWKPPNQLGSITVRGWWNGDPTLDLNMVLSANQTLIEH